MPIGYFIIDSLEELYDYSYCLVASQHLVGWLIGYSEVDATHRKISYVALKKKLSIQLNSPYILVFLSSCSSTPHSRVVCLVVFLLLFLFPSLSSFHWLYLWRPLPHFPFSPLSYVFSLPFRLLPLCWDQIVISELNSSVEAGKDEEGNQWRWKRNGRLTKRN